MKNVRFSRSFDFVAGFGKLFACVGLIAFSFETKAVADGPWNAYAGFSSTQGANQWYYQQRPQGGGAVTNMIFADAQWRTTPYDGHAGWEGNYLSVSDGHPGQSVDVIRKWVAPSSGTISITGRVYKIDTGGGAGVVASVEKNGSSIWSKTLAYNDGIGYTTDADLGSVSVVSGDSIAFIVDDNGVFGNDWFGWDPTITKTNSYEAYANFSSIQGTNQWYYQQRPQTGGTSTNMVFSNLEWRTTDSGVTGWEGNYLGFADGHPGQSVDIIRKWIAPSTGTISVTGRVYKLDTGGGAGIKVSVEQNGSAIWGPKVVAYNDAIGYSTDANLGNVSVNSGDSIAFIVDDNGSYAFDWHAWDPTIALINSSAPTWALNTGDTLLTLSIIGNRPAITRLEDAATYWNWVPSPIVLPLVDKVYISGTENLPNWSYTTAALDTSSGTKVTLTFGSTSPSLTLTQVWWAHSGSGPVEETSSITNNTGGSVTYNDVDIIASDLTVTADNAVTLWRFNRASYGGGSGDPNFTTGVLKTAISSSANVSSTISDDINPGSYLLPFCILDVGGVHGLYLGYETDFGIFNTTTSGNADVIRNLFYLWNSNSFVQGSGATTPLPGMFYGAYSGTTETGSNKMKQWYWNNKITPTTKSNTNEPLTEASLTVDSESEANTFFAANPSMATWGSELVKEDAWWTDDVNTDGPFGWDWSPNAGYWPNGMKLGTIVHSNGMKLALYMGNRYKHTDLSTAAGVSSEETALNTRFNGNQTIDGNIWAPSGYDYWRSDENLETANDYLSHLGFVQVLDYMISNHSGFRWENCSGGGSKKSFDLLQRQSNQTTEDSGAGTDAEEHYRMAYYPNSYMINPVQMQDTHVSTNGADTDNWAKYTMRGGFLGGWMFGQAGSSFQDLSELKYHLALYRTHQRPILRGADVYHILPICDLTHWDGIEFFNSVLNKGSVVLFKPNSGAGSSPIIHLQGLIPTGTYSLTFQDRSGLNSSYTSVSGSTLMTTGIGSLSGTTGDYDSEIIWINY